MRKVAACGKLLGAKSRAMLRAIFHSCLKPLFLPRALVTDGSLRAPGSTG